jgi:hypothetical protein
LFFHFFSFLFFFHFFSFYSKSCTFWNKVKKKITRKGLVHAFVEERGKMHKTADECKQYNIHGIFPNNPWWSILWLLILHKQIITAELLPIYVERTITRVFVLTSSNHNTNRRQISTYLINPC